jgi:hypothetical protein
VVDFVEIVVCLVEVVVMDLMAITLTILTAIILTCLMGLIENVMDLFKFMVFIGKEVNELVKAVEVYFLLLRIW